MIGNTTHPRCAKSHGGDEPRFRVSRMSERQWPQAEATTGHAPGARTELGEFWRTFRPVARTTAESLGNSEKTQAWSIGTDQGTYGKGSKSSMAGHRTAAAGMLPAALIPVTLVAGAWSAIMLCRVRLLRRNRCHDTTLVGEVRLVVERYDRGGRRRKLRLSASRDLTAVRRCSADRHEESHRRERQGSQQPRNGMDSIHRTENGPALWRCQCGGAITLVRHVAEKRRPLNQASLDLVPLHRRRLSRTSINSSIFFWRLRPEPAWKAWATQCCK